MCPLEKWVPLPKHYTLKKKTQSSFTYKQEEGGIHKASTGPSKMKGHKVSKEMHLMYLTVNVYNKL